MKTQKQLKMKGEVHVGIIYLMSYGFIIQVPVLNDM